MKQENNGALSVIAIQLANFMCFEKAELRPGKLTILEGQNGVGKSTWVEAIKHLIDGGTDTTLVRTGTQRSKETLELSDGQTFIKDVDGRGRTRVKGGPAGKSPRAALEGLFDSVSVDPSRFLDAKKGERLEIFLRMVPLDLTAEELARVSGLDLAQCIRLLTGRHPLQALELAREAIVQERRRKNVIAKEKRNSIKQLRETLSDDSKDVEKELAEQRSAYNKISEAIAERAEQVKSLLADEIKQKENDRDLILEEIDEKIRLLQAEREEVRERCRSTSERLTEEARGALDSYKAKVESERDEIAHIIGQLEEIQKRKIQDDHSRALIEEADKAAVEVEMASNALSDRLDSIHAFKKKSLSSLPFRGITVEGDDIAVDGVTFDRINTAGRIKFVLRLASELAKGRELPFLVLDGLERLDPVAFEQFKKAAIKSRMQILTTRPTVDPKLTVRTYDEDGNEKVEVIGK